MLSAWGKEKVNCAVNREFALLFHFAVYLQTDSYILSPFWVKDGTKESLWGRWKLVGWYLLSLSDIFSNPVLVQVFPRSSGSKTWLVWCQRFCLYL